MIDLHCHILPGIDDGAVDLEDSMAMAAQGSAEGIEVICATPHIRHDHDVRIAELTDRIGELNAELARRGMEIRVEPGGEVAETILERLEPAELRAVTLGGGGRWILLEPAPGPLSESLHGAVRHLGDRGLRALIAHPERHFGPDLEDRLRAMIEAGALVQATAAFFLDAASAPAMLGLAQRGLIHVLGSDAHSAAGGRPVGLSAALERLRALEPLAPHLDWISEEAPRAIIGGHHIEPPFEPGVV